jgi:hypothetical protein
MILDATTRSLEVVLAGAVTTNQLNVTSEWVDMTASATTGGATTANTNSTTAVTIVAAPAASTQRRILGVSIYNADTVAAVVAVRYNDNSTIRTIIKIAVPSGFTLFYTDTAGWAVTAGALASVAWGSITGTLSAQTDLQAALDAKAAKARAVNALSISSGVVNIDCSLGDYFTLALSANVSSVTFSNLPASGFAQTIMVRITQDASSAKTLAFPSSFKWAGGSLGVVSTTLGAIDVLAITTFDQGTSWRATLGKAFA